MLGRSTAGLVTLSAPVLAALLLAGCASDAADPPASTVTVTPSSGAAPTPSAAPAPTASATQAPAPPETPTAAPAPTEADPGVIPRCPDSALAVSAGPVEEADTLRRVAISFTNTSSQVCGLVSYPSADLLGGPGTVLVHIAKRPANAAPRLTLQPGDAAGADVQSSTIDSITGENCGRTGTLAVTPPDNTRQRVLDVLLPICDATISAVG